MLAGLLRNQANRKSEGVHSLRLVPTEDENTQTEYRLRGGSAF